MVGTFHFTAPANMASVKVYAVGDLHIGSPDCNNLRVKRILNEIILTKNAYVIYIGDQIDNALMGSPSSVYTQRLSPQDQIAKVADFFRPHAEQGKILAIMDGNHEARSVRTAGLSPTALIAKILGIEDKYTPTTGIVRVGIGANVYTIYATHGSGGGGTIGAKTNAIERLTRIVDADVYVSGHTHEPFVFWRDFIRLDPLTGEERMATRIFANCGSCLNYRGSYGDGRFAPSAYGYPCVEFFRDGRDPVVSMVQ